MLERALDGRVLRQLSLASNLRMRKRLKKDVGIGENKWFIYNSTFENYYLTFEPVLQGRDLFYFLGTKQPLTVLDLMASTEAIESLFIRADFLRSEQKLGISVSREDERDSYAKKRDQRLGIAHIVGDIQEGGTWREIEKTLGGRKVDLTIERAEGGLNGILNDRRLCGILIRKAWNLLAENGMMLIETPHPSILTANHGIDLVRWERCLKGNGIDVISRIHNRRYGVLKIEKTADSPIKLPLLT